LNLSDVDPKSAPWVIIATIGIAAISASVIKWNARVFLVGALCLLGAWTLRYRPRPLFPILEPRIMEPATLAQLSGNHEFRCELPLLSARPSSVHLWAVPYRNPPGVKLRQFNNGPIPFDLSQKDLDGFVWTGTMDLDDQKIARVSFGYGYFVFCHSAFPDDPPIDDANISNAIANAARTAGRTMDRP
jgi:hypothetical protein